ncbi:MAG: ribose 5-phosphate isomerase B [Geminicoccaceae bacterium]
MTALTIALGADHAGFELKDSLKAAVSELGHQVLDLGTNTAESVDYPDFGKAVAQAVAEGRADRGIIVCGTGIGISIAANKVTGCRAAVCHDVTTARMARLHNDANVLALGARVVGPQVARDCLDAFLTTEFEGGRHARRVDKLA